MGRYDKLRDALVANKSSAVSFSFKDVEAIIGRPLPRSAYDYAAWWNSEDPDRTTHVQSKSWGAAGYKAEANLALKTVTFRRR